jgi:hypothetical protein
MVGGDKAIAPNQAALVTQANLIGIPNGIPRKKLTRYIILKSISYMISSDYPGPPNAPP